MKPEQQIIGQQYPHKLPETHLGAQYKLFTSDSVSCTNVTFVSSAQTLDDASLKGLLLTWEVLMWLRPSTSFIQ